MNNIILCGMQYGDEGKGTFVDYLAHKYNINCIVKYNGGSQASHTVITPEGILHKFSQLGSGMFLENCHTFITENMVINLDNLLVELEIFSNKTGIPLQNLLGRIHIHENCFVVTPYHKLMNKLRELSKGENRRGSVGTGVSEVITLLREPKLSPFEQPLGLSVKSIFDPYSANPIKGRLEALQEYTENFYRDNYDIIWKNMPRELVKPISKEINFLLERLAFLKVSSMYIEKFRSVPVSQSLNGCLYNAYETTLRKNYSRAIFEGSQGLLIDDVYGIKPNTTHLDTTNNFALDISYYRDKIRKIGIAKAFTSRHGPGIFPTENSIVSERIHDENQDESFWNGKIRFGWFDAVLLRYAQTINQVDELFLSSLDKLDTFDFINVCNSYVYHGEIDETFKKIFKYQNTCSDSVVITDIKEHHEKLHFYLKNCVPIYETVQGWLENTSIVTDKAQLPKKCIEYITLLEDLIRIPITVVSVGPTRENKISALKEIKNDYI